MFVKNCEKYFINAILLLFSAEKVSNNLTVQQNRLFFYVFDRTKYFGDTDQEVKK